MHGMKNKTSGHFGKKTKVGMGTKTKTPGERMHEMKKKQNNISSGMEEKRNKSE
jgi:hypothetical protein